ncbi:methyltransferase domain-containing protein [Halapricum hydrolyticum]|uniref:tRNA (guanine(10)-N(2))-dimethyltransferase n=1 Tax=Halapricum hydrolyticum TaxID=2979991 RepID=A0AAE3LFQ4_9EURY|nr:methyltransferase domain-containing protein [Halapricum hydrolyticum]MCU4718963.1 methyltransferase domain-containing protein [Halapricum hydrolyticum]MCU4727892.1 methyltransferase domain-containing protein [Halapricum hydrolyticum]
MYVLELAGQDDGFAVAEAATAASDVTPIAAGLATARGLEAGFETLAFTHRAAELIGLTGVTIESAVALLTAAGIDRTGTVAVRARDVRSTTGIDTQAAERALGDVLVERGFTVDLDDPDHVLQALFAGRDGASAVESGGASPTGGQDVIDPDDGVCALGWLVAETDRDFADRQPTDRPFFQPGSMEPALARAIVNLVGAGPDTTILDPMCGTGGLLLEAGRVDATPIGGDVQAKMVRGTRENLRALLAGPWHLYRGDAGRVPLADDSIDGVVFDAPYGRQSKIEGDLDDLVADALAEARRVATRGVVVGDRSWAGAAERVGWTVEATFERRVHRSLVRYISVLR